MGAKIKDMNRIKKFSSRLDIVYFCKRFLSQINLLIIICFFRELVAGGCESTSLRLLP